jgi:quinol monooxygenase YgiN
MRRLARLAPRVLAMASTSVFVKLVSHPGKRDELLEVLTRLMPVVADEQGTHIYSFHLDSGDPETLWAFELYEDEAAFFTHGAGEVLGEVMGEVLPLLAEPPVLAVATPTHAKGFDV